jgi:hypothetical protein
LVLYDDVSHKALAGLIRDTKIGTRFERELKEAEREGSGEGVDRQEGQAAEEDEESEREVEVEAARREETLEETWNGCRRCLAMRRER